MLNLLGFIIILSITVMVHEFGHFISAKLHKVKVEKFSIGFGPVIFKKVINSMDFLVSLIPLGGYVKLAGDERSKFKNQPYEFLSKSTLEKIKIVIFGPLFNYIFAFLIFWVIAILGIPYEEPVIGKILEDHPAATVGIKEKDRVLEVNNIKVKSWTNMVDIIHKSKDKVFIKIKRDNQILDFTVPLKTKELTDLFGKKHYVSVIGISSAGLIKFERYNFFIAFFKAIQLIFSLTSSIIYGLFLVIVGAVPFKEAVTGPLGIYYITSEAMKLGILALLNTVAVLNLSLAIINLFPLPVFDGGHIAIFIFENIRRKPISEKTESILTNIGFAIIGILFIFVFYNDIVRLGSKIFLK